MKSLKVILIAGGALLTVLGVHEALVARVWKPEVHEISCEELSTRGPGSNAHVRLVSFHLVTKDALHEETPKGGWKRVWIPALPAADAGTPAFDPTAFRVLVRTDRVKTPTDLERLSQQAWIDGLVVNEIETLASHELRPLEDKYPHTQIDRCWIVDHERRLMSAIEAEELVLGGLLLLGVGLWLSYGTRKKRASPLDAALGCAGS